MRFDDRLATVLSQPAADAHGRAVQWRQLVELVARAREVNPTLRDRALARIVTLMADLPGDLIAATARAIAGQAVPAELVALFAARGAGESAALIAAANLTPAGWSAVRAVAADDVLPLLNAVASVPDAEQPSTPIAVPPERQMAEAQADIAAPAPETKSEAQPKTSSKPAPLPAGLFRWETGPTGEIDWVEGAPRAALVGRSVAESFADSFTTRLPFADEPLVLGEEGALAGEWRWTGAPAFFADTGRFAGYRGVARREGFVAPPEVLPAATAAEDDGLRELMHELRTPLNAIIGFGEIIEGQYLGPAHRGYRQRAAEIVRQARHLSDAVDNLDLAARLRSGRIQGEQDSDIAALRSVLEDLGQAAEDRQVQLKVVDRLQSETIGLPPALTERLVRQFVSAMLHPAVAGEAVAIVLEARAGKLSVGVDRATALKGLTEQQLLADRGRAGMRFALRLVQGLAGMVGGGFEIGDQRLTLLLPLTD